jgi:hypothetical protein
MLIHSRFAGSKKSFIWGYHGWAPMDFCYEEKVILEHSGQDGTLFLGVFTA